MEPHLELLRIEQLLDGWSRVIRIFYRLFRRDGTVQEQDRDVLDRGDGITVILFNSESRSVLLLKQPRISALMRQDDASTIEACNGQVEDEQPLQCALREVEQETGYRLATLQPLATVYASPGASLELIHLFFGQYTSQHGIGNSGGLRDEGEDIETFEASVEQTSHWIDDGTIRDARTILAFELARRRGLLSTAAL